MPVVCSFCVSRCGVRSPSRRGFSTPRRCAAIAVHPAQFEGFLLDLQSDILKDAEALEREIGSDSHFMIDRWERDESDPNAGYGITAVLEGGQVLEKAAANISVIKGSLSATRAQAMSARGRDCIDPAGGQQYSALAMSLVFHSAHPFIPTLRADVRVFEVAGTKWFGGGCDLTPNYLTAHVASEGQSLDLRSDIEEFHASWKAVCDKHDQGLYPSYKAWCDNYFFIPCRSEHRGTGGIFFDDLEASSGLSFEAEAFTRDVGANILASWLPIARRRCSLAFDASHREWQELRRGRYIEFNLLYDRGVKFGLDGGRIESIMVSAPPRVQWAYKKSVAPAHDSAEAEMLEVLQQPSEWA